MFETSGAGDEGWGATPPPPAADRLWRHPSEMARVQPAPASGRPSTPRPDHRSHRFSLGTVVVAGSLGALVMFGTLAATGLVGGVSAPLPPDTATQAGADALSGAGTVPPTPDGVVSVRLVGSTGTTFGAGLVFNTAGDIVTALPTNVDGRPAGVVSIESSGITWTDATVVGSDPMTGLTVLRPPSSTLASARRATVAAAVGTPVLGQAVDLVRADAGAIGARFRTGTATRVTSTNTSLTTPTSTLVGLVTLTSPRPAGPGEIGIDRSSGSVAALVVPVDDNVEDEMAYAMPADVAVTIGRQIEATGYARHGALDALLSTTADAALVVSAVPTSSGLLVGDELLAVEGRPVHTDNDVLGVLLGVRPGSTVSVTVRRDNRQRAVDVTAGSREGDLASTTTIP